MKESTIAYTLFNRGDVSSLDEASVLVSEFKHIFLQVLEEEGPEAAEDWFVDELGLEVDFMSEFLI